MLTLVVLGNRLKDDGSMSDLMRERLNLALEIEVKLSPDLIILSGGVANKKAKIPEAQVMEKFLTEKGVDGKKLLQENKSLSTKQNAKFSVPLAAQRGTTQLLLCTSSEHMHRSFLNPIQLFSKQLKKYPNVTLRTCCCVEDLEILCK